MSIGPFNRKGLALVVVTLAVTLSACGSSHKAPVETIDFTPNAAPPPKLTYTGRTAIVKKGDNLYSISFLSGQNYLEVAKWNDMDPEDIIHPGQEIKLYPPEGSQAAVPDTEIQAPEAAPQQQETSSSTPTPQIPSTAVTDWTWPAQGQLISRFSTTQRRNGIEIAGDLGSPVRVTANGRVVYSGTGLIGYGRIIIVKHDKQHLSVYAHNSRVVVKEGDTVSQGQKIAEMGSTDADRVKLHFEIRRNGKPIDPLGYLPKA